LYEAKRAASRFCSDRCRVRNHQNGGKPRPATVELPAVTGGVVSETTATLEGAGRLQTPLGQLAVLLASRIDSDGEHGSGLAALSKELRATMLEALDGVELRVDTLDELRVRRDSRAAAV
jgi:hypothetical protein